MKQLRPFIALALFLALISLSTVAMAGAPVKSPGLAFDLTPSPPLTATPPGGGGSAVTSITEIFHHLVFPAETISEALTGIFNQAADREVNAMSEEVARWTQVMGEIVQAPGQGDYSKVAQSSLPVAAALAPALFLLRLALYHWGRLLGDDDSGLRVVGDWVTAGALAIVSGPFLDLIVRLGWWMVGKVIGETSGLAVKFRQATTATSVLLGIANLTFLGGLISIGLAIGSLMVIAGLLFAFSSANAVLFILEVLAPPLVIASVLPQTLLLRSLWMKAVTLIALLPIVAGGVFKAGLAAGTWLGQQGLLSAIIRVIWLWGATGLLLSLAGILGRMTIMTTADAFGQMVQTAKQIASVAALAASGVGAAGAAGGAVGGSGAAGAGAAASVAGPSPTGAGLTGGEAALGHLNAAQELTQRSAAFEAMGLHTPAAYNRSLAHGHELAARQVELSERMQRFGGAQTTAPDFGFSPSVNTAMQSNFKGTPEEFRTGFAGLSPHITGHGLDPNAVAAQYPEDTAHMVQAFISHSDEINGAQNPLQRAMQLGNAEQLQKVITFMPLKGQSGDGQA